MAYTNPLRKEIIQEHTIELGKRVHVWKGLRDGINKTYIFDAEHQRRYDLLVLSKRIYSVMTDAELKMFMDRTDRADQAEANQVDLFTE
jgi:hypothetical protein